MDKQILKKLVSYGIYPTKSLGFNYNPERENADNIIHNDDGEYMQVETNAISKEDLKLALEIKKIDEIQSIKGMVKFFFTWAIISLIFDLLWFLYLLGEGISFVDVIASFF